MTKFESAAAGMTEALKLLGARRRDVVTGFTGVVTSVCYDVSGCIQAAIKPAMDKDGKMPDGNWFDLDRLEESGERAMDPFSIGDAARPAAAPAAAKGPAEKPAK